MYMPGKQHSKAFPSFYTLSLSSFLYDIAPSTGQTNTLQGQSLLRIDTWFMVEFLKNSSIQFKFK